MPTPIERPSLTTPLSQRYATQHVGGAFDDRAIDTEGFNALFASYQSQTFQIYNGFDMAVKQGISDFKNDGYNLSFYVQGLDRTKYTTTFPT
jgi:hypothetical protein